MGGNAFQHVRSGDSIRFYAESYNAMMDAARAHRRRRPQGTSPISTVHGNVTVEIVNASGKYLSRFSIVGLDGPATDPALDPDEFCNRIVFRGVIPNSSHAGKFAVLQDDLESGDIGRAVVYGTSVAKIQSTETTVERCDVEAGTSDYLVSGGGVEVLWIAPPNEADAPRWAIIRIGGGGVGNTVTDIRATVMEAVPPNESLSAELPAFGRVRIHGKSYGENEYDLCGCWELAYNSNEHLPVGKVCTLQGPYSFIETAPAENPEDEPVEVKRTYYLAKNTTGEYSGRLATRLDYNSTSTISVGSGSEMLVFTVRATALASGDYFQVDAGVRTRRITGFGGTFLEVIGGPCPLKVES